MNRIKILRCILFLLFSLLNTCLYARNWKVINEETVHVLYLKEQLQLKKQKDKMHFNLHAWKELKNQNPDFWAWIQWEDNLVSQPIVIDTGGQQYLHLSFKQEKSLSGTPFIFDIEAKNKVIYGHHVGYGTSDSVFTNLANLIDKNQFYEHQKFYLCLEKKVEEYTLLLVSEKGTWDYQQKEFHNTSEFYSWIQNARETSIVYDDSLNPRYQDSYITIQTCKDSYSSKRIILLAIKTDEYVLHMD